MNLVFMGTPDFAVSVLDALIAKGHKIRAAYSQPPRPAGRGQSEQPSPVHRRAIERGIEVRAPVSLRDAEEQHRFADLKADAAIVVAYGLLLPAPILVAPKHGCFNVHASLLPRWRGAAPIQRAIMAGDAETGISIMRMEQGLDTGPVCLTKRIPINAATTFASLHDELATLGAAAMVEALAKLEAGALDCKAQSADGVTYAKKIDKAEARIDFNRAAADVRNHIHGLSPFPGAWFSVSDRGRDVRVKVLRCEVVEGSGTVGQVLDDRLTIACAAGAVRFLEVQREGKAAMSADSFLRGLPVPADTRIG
ncbi:MAG: methionyl-tRNA formyltransferase [Rhizobiales bacterium]|nr:methionyl-tRNA formyltransferase [Hyphomicrobiales bacterium]